MEEPKEEIIEEDVIEEQIIKDGEKEVAEDKEKPYKLKVLLDEFQKKATPVFVNGIGLGKILEVQQDYIKFRVVKENKETKKKKVDGKMTNYDVKTLVKEVTYIPIDKIETISEGEQEVPKTEKDDKIDSDLADL